MTLWAWQQLLCTNPSPRRLACYVPNLLASVLCPDSIPFVGFEPGDAWEVSADLLNAVLNLKHRRPQLMLRNVDYDNPGFEREMMKCQDIPDVPTPWGW